MQAALINLRAARYRVHSFDLHSSAFVCLLCVKREDCWRSLGWLGSRRGEIGISKTVKTQGPRKPHFTPIDNTTTRTKGRDHEVAARPPDFLRLRLAIGPCDSCLGRLGKEHELHHRGRRSQAWWWLQLCGLWTGQSWALCHRNAERYIYLLPHCRCHRHHLHPVKC